MIRRTLCLGFLLASPLGLHAAPQSVDPAPGRPVQGGTGTTHPPFDLVGVHNGFGTLVPHEVLELDAQGQPTAVRLPILEIEDLLANVTPTNPVLPVQAWPPAAVLPNGDAGNHYIALELDAAIAIDSVLDASPSGAASALLGPVSVLAFHPLTGLTTPVPGRAFVGGRTYAGTPTGVPPAKPLQQWFSLQGGQLVANPAIDNDNDGVPDGLGVPGTQSAAFAHAALLASPRTLLFVVDSDGDLATHETFPVQHQIQLRANVGVRSQAGTSLERAVLGSSTVGLDVLAPEVALTPPPASVPVTVPPFGAVDVDPGTTVTIQFTEPVQPLSVGDLPGAYPKLSPTVRLSFGPVFASTNVPFSATPESVFDFSRWVLTPAFAFPGKSPVGAFCGGFDQVRINVFPGQLADLRANLNLLPMATAFTTGEGPGLVNAPVLPDAVYVLRAGPAPSLSVIDLNGFGQSTGDPTFTGTLEKGHSNFPNNPNVKFQGSMLAPPLAPGACTFDGGSSGVFSLTRDSNLQTGLVRPPLVTSVGAVQIGRALDTVYNDGLDATGCQQGGGNVCAISGLKMLEAHFGAPGGANFAVPANVPGVAGFGPANSAIGLGNPISWAPHPNPPALIFPPLCASPYIGGQEPTRFRTIAPSAQGGLGLVNLLVPGDAQGDPLQGLPPRGLLAEQQNTWFEGPDLPNLPLGACMPHMQRQKIGHFLYLVDRARGEVVVLDSNRMHVLDRICVEDPTELAMGPNLDFLAVTDQASRKVHFIDIDPASATFHGVVKSVAVGGYPKGIAWDPGNENIFVCNELDHTVSVISAHDLELRKTLSNFLDSPFDVVVTQRQDVFGTQRNVHFAWILNRNGDLTLFESGPAGIGGLGYDDTIGTAPMHFENPKRIIADPLELDGGVWIAHEDALDASGQPTGVPGGAVTRVRIQSSVTGPLILTAGDVGTPQFRSMALVVDPSLDSSVVTGIPIDLALDEQVNLGVTPNLSSSFSAGTPLAVNGKSMVRASNVGFVAAKSPQFLLIAVPNSSEGPGVVDVVDLATLQRHDTDAWQFGVQSIQAPGVFGLADYWRQ
jgi:hypothetical protein